MKSCNATKRQPTKDGRLTICMGNFASRLAGVMPEQPPRLDLSVLPGVVNTHNKRSEFWQGMIDWKVVGCKLL